MKQFDQMVFLICCFFPYFKAAKICCRVFLVTRRSPVKKKGGLERECFRSGERISSFLSEKI